MSKTILTLPEWGECIEETGQGSVLEVSGDGRNRRVVIRADHLREDVTGWLDTHGPLGHLLDRLVGRRVNYRIVVHRKPDAPVDAPIRDVPPRSKVRDVQGLEIHGDDANGHQAASNESANGTGDGAQPPGAPASDSGRASVGEGSGVAPGPPQCKRCGRPILGAARRGGAGVYVHADDADCDPAGNAPGPAFDPDRTGGGPAAPVEAPRRRAPRIEEAKPWEPHNSDGSLNLGSYQVVAAVALVELADELLRARNLAGGAGAVPDYGAHCTQRARLARSLARIADQIQAAVRADGHSDRMDASHTRARGALRTALEVYVPPFGAEPDAQERWRHDVATYAIDLLRTAIDLVA